MHSQWHRDVRTQRPCSLTRSGVTDPRSVPVSVTVTVTVARADVVESEAEAESRSEPESTIVWFRKRRRSHQVGNGCTRMRPKLHLPVASGGRFHWQDDHQVPSHWCHGIAPSRHLENRPPLQGGVACRLGSFIIKAASSKKSRHLEGCAASHRYIRE
jgi:hypothetical protein